MWIGLIKSTTVPGAFQSAASLLGLRVSKFVCAPFKSESRQLQKDREDEKAEGYVPDEGTRKNPRKTTK